MAKWKRETAQWPNEKERQHNGQMKKTDNTMAKWKGQKDTKRSSNTNPTKTEDEIMCSIRISSFWSTCDICRITLVTHLSYYSCYTPVVLLLLHTCRITLVTHLSYYSCYTPVVLLLLHTCRITLDTHLSYYSCYTPVVLLLLHTCRFTLVTHLSYYSCYTPVVLLLLDTLWSVINFVLYIYS